MSYSTTVISDQYDIAKELTCYLQSTAIEISLVNMHTIERQYGAHYTAQQYLYQLLSGKLSVLRVTLSLPFDSSRTKIEAARLATLKAATVWQKRQNKQSETTNHAVLVLDIHLTDEGRENTHAASDDKKYKNQRVKHHFGARYFMEQLVLDTDDSVQRLQVFSWQDWHSTLEALQTPCELWRFLDYHLEQLESAINGQVSSFETETVLVTQFLNRPALFAPAIVLDNALIKYNIQDAPNPALASMTLAYKNKSITAQMYHQHLQQAAHLWSQLSAQMVETSGEKHLDNEDKAVLATGFIYWQQQLLDESLFSRHELVRTLYKHPKQDPQLQQTGYVVHQHSYESLGRHYVLIFYGQEAEGRNGKKTIQPNLSKIAQDVATRLPIAELHHVIVLGIDFIKEAEDTFMDIDLWIQPVNAMTQRERHLTKQLQHLKKQTPK
ncbi:hypothetical protein [Psychrobacter alimentarius]|uniref:hypothetical protein n=1 Tax=Psychrobacter alimentarius TaxID=261164 RepID=UPI003FD329F0